MRLQHLRRNHTERCSYQLTMKCLVIHQWRSSFTAFCVLNHHYKNQLQNTHCFRSWPKCIIKHNSMQLMILYQKDVQFSWIKYGENSHDLNYQNLELSLRFLNDFKMIYHQATVGSQCSCQIQWRLPSVTCQASQALVFTFKSAAQEKPFSEPLDKNGVFCWACWCTLEFPALGKLR